MNYGIDATEQYYKELEKLIKIHNTSANWIKPLKQGLIEYAELYPTCTYKEVIIQFGKPEEILNEHLSDTNTNHTISRKNVFVTLVLICVALVVICTALFIIIKANQINIATNEYIILDVSEDSSN